VREREEEQETGEAADNKGIFGTRTKFEVKASVMADLPSNCWGNITKELSSWRN